MEPIACDLGALTPAERERRAALAQAVVARAEAIGELDDGYCLRLRATAPVAHECLEWLLLEQRCCPFLRLELELANEGALSLRLRGGPGVKEFLAAAGLASRSRASAACRC